MEIDPHFRRTGALSAKRRNARLRKRAAIGTAVVVTLLVLVWSTRRLFIGGTDIVTDIDPDAEQAVQFDAGGAAAPLIRVETPFVDIAGDPMILRFERAGTARAVPLPGPPTLDAVRLRLSVSASTMTAMTPGPYPSYRICL